MPGPVSENTEGWNPAKIVKFQVVLLLEKAYIWMEWKKIAQERYNQIEAGLESRKIIKQEMD